MAAKAAGLGRRSFLRGVGLTAMAGVPAQALSPEPEQARPASTGAILHATVGQRIPLAGAREQTFKDSLRPNRTQAEIEANRKYGIV